MTVRNTSKSTAASQPSSGGGANLPSGNNGDILTRVNGSWVGVPKETVIGQALAAINFTPTVPADNVTSVQDQQLTGNVLTDVTTITGTPRVTDYSIAGTKYTAGVSSTTNPLGTFVLRQDGTWTLDPVLYTSGAMPQITYTVSNGIATETGTLNITLTHVNHAPTAGADSGSSTGTAVTISVLANDTDPDSDTLTITRINATNVTAGGSAVAITNGTVALNAQGTGLVVTPAGGFTTGTLSFNYTISDGNGSTTTGAVTVTVSPPQAGGTSNWVLGTTTVVPFNWAANGIANSLFMMEIKPEGQGRKWFLGPACNLTPGAKADYNEAPASINIAGTRVITSGDWGGTAPQAVGGPYDGERYIDMYEITLPTNWQSHWG